MDAAASQGMLAASRSGKRQEMDSPLEPPEGTVREQLTETAALARHDNNRLHELSHNRRS